MDSTKLNDWLQVIGIFAVVASLMFVGLQMQQTQEIAVSQAYQSRVATVVEWNSAFAANPAALSAHRKAAAGNLAEIAPEEYEAIRYTLQGLFHLFDNAYYQYQQGFVSQEFWDMTRGSLKVNMMNPVTNAIFKARLDREVRPDFRAVLLKIVEELETKPGE